MTHFKIGDLVYYTLGTEYEDSGIRIRREVLARVVNITRTRYVIEPLFGRGPLRKRYADSKRSVIGASIRPY